MDFASGQRETSFLCMSEEKKKNDMPRRSDLIDQTIEWEWPKGQWPMKSVRNMELVQ